MLFCNLVILSVISRIFTQSSLEINSNELDLLMLIERKYKIGLDITDSDFMMNLTRKNHTFKMAAQALFPDRTIPEPLFMYFKLQPKVKSFTIMSIRDPNQRMRFQIRGFERRGQVNEFRVNVTIDPLVEPMGLSRNHFVRTTEFTVPFLYSPWTVGILFEKGKMTFYTSCDDVEKPLGYHIVGDIVPFGTEMFESGATMYLFNDGNIENPKDKFVGTVSEFIITNHTRLQEFMCREEAVQGSGSKINFWKMKFLGNVLLIKNTTPSPTSFQTTSNNPTTTTATSHTSPHITTSAITPERTTKTMSPSTPTSTKARSTLSTHSVSSSTISQTTSTSMKSKFTETAKLSLKITTETFSVPSLNIRKGEMEGGSIESNGSDCDCLKFIRFNKSEKGAKGLNGSKGERGEKGDKGAIGLSGPAGQNGTCSATLCHPIPPLKGDKGETGERGYCSIDVCNQGAVKGSGGEKGTSGFPGQKGDKGDRVSASDVIQSITPDIKNTVEDYLAKNIKSYKGEPGSCNCDTGKSSDNKKTQVQTVVLNDATELKSISTTMTIGQMVFLIVENILLIKVDEVKNRWRIVKLDDTQSDWFLMTENTNIMPSQQLGPITNSQTFVDKGSVDSGFQLMLVALSRPTAGDLRSIVHEPGAYTGSSYQCQKNAYNFNLGRAFYPLINTDTFDFRYMVPEKYRYDVPIVNRKHERIATSFDELMKVTNQITVPIFDFNEKSIMTSIKPPCIWIGKRPTLYENKSSGDDGICVNWMTRRRNSTGTTIRLVMGKSLFDPTLFEETPCKNYCHVLCMQIYPSTTNQVRKYV